MERARVRVHNWRLEDPALPPLREALMKARAQASALLTRVRVTRCPEEEPSRGSRAGYSGSCTQEGRPQGRGPCRGGEVGQLKG